MAYTLRMVFIETTVFTRQVLALLPDEDYAELQAELARDPKAGDVIEDTGGLRKMRVAAKGKGKRGGARLIYYFVDAADQCRMLLIYPKGKKDDLTADEKRQLRRVIEEWK